MYTWERICVSRWEVLRRTWLVCPTFLHLDSVYHIKESMYHEVYLYSVYRLKDSVYRIKESVYRQVYLDSVYRMKESVYRRANMPRFRVQSVHHQLYLDSVYCVAVNSFEYKHK